MQEGTYILAAQSHMPNNKASIMKYIVVENITETVNNIDNFALRYINKS